jgi:hypothetical protein
MIETGIYFVKKFNEVKILPWKRYEKKKTKEHRGKHLGGPGKPDYIRGKIQGEIKSWSRPMSKNNVMQEARKGRNEITSKRGFTKSAIEYVNRYRPTLKLFHRKKRIR